VLTPIFDKFHKQKAGTPVGGGLLVVITTLLLFGFLFWILPFMKGWYQITSLYESAIKDEIKILLFSFTAFAIIGLYDDVKKTFILHKQDVFGLRFRHKLFFEVIISLLIGYWLYDLLKIDILNIPFFGVVHLGFWYIPFAALVVLWFTNAINITDGLDGLSTGLLMIALFAFWVISAAWLDTPLSLFIAILLGGLISFLYFNIYPARIILGDVGALAFGAIFAVIGLILGKFFTLIIIGGIFVLEGLSSLVQLLSKRFLKKKIVPVAPLHLYFQYIGWEEPKIVMRFWLAGIMLAIFGLLMAFLTACNSASGAC
jgi:phospho-N-acetylmuramoyl-pentapeptide-transferase